MRHMGLIPHFLISAIDMTDSTYRNDSITYGVWMISNFADLNASSLFFKFAFTFANEESVLFS